jgi:hypothetical protein
MAQPFPHCAGPLESTRTGGPTPWMPVVKATGRRGKSNSSTVARASRPRVPIQRGTGVPPQGSQAPWHGRPARGFPSTLVRASHPRVPKHRGTGVPPVGSQAPWHGRPTPGSPSTVARASRPWVPKHCGTGVPPVGSQAPWVLISQFRARLQSRDSYEAQPHRVSGRFPLHGSGTKLRAGKNPTHCTFPHLRCCYASPAPHPNGSFQPLPPLTV